MRGNHTRVNCLFEVVPSRERVNNTTKGVSQHEAYFGVDEKKLKIKLRLSTWSWKVQVATAARPAQVLVAAPAALAPFRLRRLSCCRRCERPPN